MIWDSEMVEKRVGGEFLSRILETHFRVVFYDVFGGCEVTKMQSSHLNSHRRPHGAQDGFMQHLIFAHRKLMGSTGHQFPCGIYLLYHVL